jgi:hypothetical protein
LITTAPRRIASGRRSCEAGPTSAYVAAPREPLGCFDGDGSGANERRWANARLQRDAQTAAIPCGSWPAGARPAGWRDRGGQLLRVGAGDEFAAGWRPGGLARPGCRPWSHPPPAHQRRGHDGLLGQGEHPRGWPVPAAPRRLPPRRCQPRVTVYRKAARPASSVMPQPYDARPRSTRTRPRCRGRCSGGSMAIATGTAAHDTSDSYPSYEVSPVHGPPNFLRPFLGWRSCCCRW